MMLYLILIATTADCTDRYCATCFAIGPDFEWGTATAAFQIEGGNTQSDWAQWEARCELDAVDGRRGGDETIVDCASNLDGPDAWSHYAADFQAAQAMGHNAARLGIEWAKIEAVRGEYDSGVLAHYHAVLDAARAAGLKPMVTLQHFTLPSWVHNLVVPEAGLYGWPGSGDDTVGGAPVVAEFERFAGDMAEEFGTQVDLWVTINEPLVSLLGGYVSGDFPPGERLKVLTMLRGAYNMAYAHARAYDAIHQRDAFDGDGDGGAAAVSIAHHWRIFDPVEADDPPTAALRLDYLFNRLFLDAIWAGRIDANADGDVDDSGDRIDVDLQRRLDWLGINYYGRHLVYDVTMQLCDGLVCGLDDGVEVPILVAENQDPAVPHSDMGWEIYPEGFYRALMAASTYGLPIRVTENGIADAAGTQRAGFIVAHVQQMQRAMAEGADVRGYYHWSLVDNFEWAMGYGPRFGLLRVDYNDSARARTRAGGAQAYSDIIVAGGVNDAIVAAHGILR